MTFKTEVFERDAFASEAAQAIANALEGASSLVLTGGTTAEKIYPALAALPVRWATLDVFFSDERCVPPNDPASNFGMAERLLFDRAQPRGVHRMKGEEPPDHAAEQYHHELGSFVKNRLDVVLLGMGADAHVGALYPGSMALEESERLCVPVDRPDGMQGLTLTPPAMQRGKKVLLLVTAEGKAATVKRVIEGSESVATCPARLLADHNDVTFLLDEPAASAL